MDSICPSGCAMMKIKTEKMECITGEFSNVRAAFVSGPKSNQIGVMLF
jgi:hypothetical protein